MYYKYEMHCHDCLCSKCAHDTPEDMVRAYQNAGYSGMVFTNHFLKGNTAVDKALPWEEKVSQYYNAYLRATAAVEGDHFHVFFGLEHNYGDGKEVLTYGIDLNFLLAHPDIDLLPLEDYSRLVHEAGGFISQAHPFRKAWFINENVLPKPKCLDAVESFNFFNTPEENARAVEFAAANGLYQTSGGDVHECDSQGIGQAGMAFENEISTAQELVSALKNHLGKQIVAGKVIV